MLLIISGVMLLFNLFFFFLFEWEKPKPKDILPIVVICCGASLGRVLFAVIPQVQPVTALVIIAGSVYGCRKGYITGAFCALISNLFLGQGPWTLFQMTAWGMVGFFAGIVEKWAKKFSVSVKTWIYAIYGVFAGFMFSIIVDLLTICYLGEGRNLASVLAVFGTGIAFNVGHAVFNGILLLFLYELLSKKLYRIKRKNL